jgi:hypothetical protein
MLKQLSICAALMVFGAGSVSAQQREAVLQKLEVLAASFDIVLATPKLQGAIYDLSDSPDALIVHLVGGELALGFEHADPMLKAVESLQQPACTFHVERKDNRSRTPVAVYIVPKVE